MSISLVSPINFKARFVDNMHLKEITSSIEPSDETQKLAEKFSKMHSDVALEITDYNAYSQYGNDHLCLSVKNLSNEQEENIEIVNYNYNDNLLDNFLYKLIELSREGADFWFAKEPLQNKIHRILTNKND